MRTESNREATAAPDEHMPASWSAEQVEEIVVHARLALYNRGKSCGPRVLREHLEESLDVRPPPSERTIARILARNGLTHGRTGWYPGESPDAGASDDSAAEETTKRR